LHEPEVVLRHVARTIEVQVRAVGRRRIDRGRGIRADVSELALGLRHAGHECRGEGEQAFRGKVSHETAPCFRDDRPGGLLSARIRRSGPTYTRSPGKIW